MCELHVGNEQQQGNLDCVHIKREAAFSRQPLLQFIYYKQ
jgi:hypothetical protein